MADLPTLDLDLDPPQELSDDQIEWFLRSALETKTRAQIFSVLLAQEAEKIAADEAAKTPPYPSLVSADWTDLKTFLTDAAGGNDVASAYAEAKAQIAADSQANFWPALYALYKAARRALPHLEVAAV